MYLNYSTLCRQWVLGILIVGVTWGGWSAGGAIAQQPEAPKEPARRKAPVIDKPEEVALRTKDGFNLQCTYFRPPQHEDLPDNGKNVLPFILLHDWEGSRVDLLMFAGQLQKAGCAVIVPDMRGHGESVGQEGALVDLKKFRKAEMAAMVNDIEACKKFLVQKNNDGELNIDCLSVVALGETSVLAMMWVVQDWYSFPPYSGEIKQGQDVKSLTLVSPSKKMGQLSMASELKHPMFAGSDPRMPNLPTLIIWAENDQKSQKDSVSIFDTMVKGRPDISSIADDAEYAEKKTVFDFLVRQSDYTGTELILQSNPVRSAIMEFVAGKVGAKREGYPWKSRVRK